MKEKDLIKKLVREILEDRAPEENPRGGEAEIVPPEERENNPKIRENARFVLDSLNTLLDSLEEEYFGGDVEEYIIELNNNLIQNLGHDAFKAISLLRRQKVYPHLVKLIKNYSGVNIDDVFNDMEDTHNKDLDESKKQKLVNEVLKRLLKKK